MNVGSLLIAVCGMHSGLRRIGANTIALAAAAAVAASLFHILIQLTAATVGKGRHEHVPTFSVLQWNLYV